MIHCTKWLEKSIKEKYDVYGDSYYNFATVNDLKHIMNTMDVSKIDYNKENLDEINITR